MSVDREVIARVYEMRKEDVICQNCRHSCNYSGGRVYCRFWGQDSRENSYCSFFDSKGEYQNETP